MTARWSMALWCRRRIRAILPAALALGILATTAGAQAPPRAAAGREQLPPEVAGALGDLTAAAEQRGLPAAPLVDKALEGAAKRVPPAQIIEALKVLLDDLGRAQGLLQGAAAEHARDLAAVAVALRRGAPPNAVRRLGLGAPPGEPFAVAVHTLADLVRRGVDERDAVDILLTWRARGGNAEALRQIPAAMDRLLREGLLPAEAASAVSAAMRAGRPPGTAGRPAGAGPPPGRPGRPDRP